MGKYTSFHDIPRFTSWGNYAVDYPLDYLVKWLDEQVSSAGLILNPDFQRGHVWTQRQQIEYIQFLLKGGRTGRDLHFNCPSWHQPVPEGAYNEFVCVDGLQRVTAVTRFIRNEIKVFGTYYKDFTDSIRTTTDVLRIHINDLPTKRQVLNWYLEMNGAGTPHTRKELRRVAELRDALPPDDT